MLTFLEETLDYLDKNYASLSGLTLILPSKRAGGFLTHYLKKRANKTSFSPKILDIETFMEKVSNIKLIDNTQLLFESYSVYLTLENIKEKESFEAYSSWATTLLGDFNEIDRYLINHTSFFNYLSSIQDVNHWYLQKEKTVLIENYLSFWESLNEFYQSLKTVLLNKGLGYQGLVNRKAAEEIEHYIAAHQNSKHIFIGFNALNTAEQNVMQELVAANLGEVLWDTDHFFYNDKNHAVSLFMRSYANAWSIYKESPFTVNTANFEKKKSIHLVEASKNISQVKYVGNLLAKMPQKDINQTAIILADETLLIPMIHSLPRNVEKVNITMGVPLTNFPLASFFDTLLQYKSTARSQIYFKDLVKIINHPFGKLLFNNDESIINHLRKNNIAYCNMEQLMALSKEENKPLLEKIFNPWDSKNSLAITYCIDLISIAKQNDTITLIDKAVLLQLETHFKQLQRLQKQYPYLDTIKSLHTTYKQLITSTTLDYKGDAYDGLQIMGVLESRVLDFKNVIMTSVNEGTLPSGKSNASFITYDLKQQFDLPKFTEKDAIYAYHFYHAIQRAENCTLLYNSHSDGLNTGEKSRFIKQLEVFKLPNHTINKITISHKVPISETNIKAVNKTEAVVLRLKEIGARYFSPSALTSYIRNPIDFYYQRVLKIQELEDVEETVAFNTMGTIVHNTLENLYQPLIGKVLTSENLSALLPLIEPEVKRQFLNEYKEGDYTQGKNLIIYEVVKKFVQNFIALETKDVSKGNEIIIQSLEQEFKTPIEIPEIDFPVNIGGKVDRIDTYNGTLRIIDYKTGKVNASDLDIVEWEDIKKDYKYSKAFQVLTYAFLCINDYQFETAEAGIISFKNLGAGFLKFSKKPNAKSRSKNTVIDTEVLLAFKEQLSEVILEIYNTENPFTEKEIA